MIARLTVVVCLAVVTVACEKKTTTMETAGPATNTAPAERAATATAAVDADVHNVACGCSMGQTCGNLIEVDGEYVPLQGDLGLGAMEFCGKTGTKARVEGEMKDGAFVATKYELVK